MVYDDPREPAKIRHRVFPMALPTAVENRSNDELEEECKKHYILVDSDVKEIKFQNSTKEHINMFIITHMEIFDFLTFKIDDFKVKTRIYG